MSALQEEHTRRDAFEEFAMQRILDDPGLVHFHGRLERQYREAVDQLVVGTPEGLGGLPGYFAQQGRCQALRALLQDFHRAQLARGSGGGSAGVRGGLPRGF